MKRYRENGYKKPRYRCLLGERLQCFAVSPEEISGDEWHENSVRTSFPVQDGQEELLKGGAELQSGCEDYRDAQ